FSPFADSSAVSQISRRPSGEGFTDHVRELHRARRIAVQLNVAQADLTVEAQSTFIRAKIHANIDSLIDFGGVINFRRNKIGAGNNISTILVWLPDTLIIRVILR